MNDEGDFPAMEFRPGRSLYQTEASRPFAALSDLVTGQEVQCRVHLCDGNET